MNLSDLASAIYTRLTGDATLSGYLTGGIRNYYAQPDASQTEATPLPYLVYVIDFGQTSNSQKGQTQEMLVTVDMYVPRQSGYVLCSQVIERVNGDATDQITGVPTFGLHLWTPTLATGNWVADVMQCSDGSSVSDDKDWFRYALVFSCHLSRTSPTS